jgi:hypothetical protein
MVTPEIRILKLTLARLTAGLFLIDTVQTPAATDELISWLLFLYGSENFHFGL